jgi:hypothetical protein
MQACECGNEIKITGSRCDVCYSDGQRTDVEPLGVPGVAGLPERTSRRREFPLHNPDWEALVSWHFAAVF